jgi:hypothetical protein
MTKSPHTPGPWLPGIKQSDNEIVVAAGVPIAEVISTDCDPEEFTANCQMIYDAPDMFAFLELLDVLAPEKPDNGAAQFADTEIITITMTGKQVNALRALIGKDGAA